MNVVLKGATFFVTLTQIGSRPGPFELAFTTASHRLVLPAPQLSQSYDPAHAKDAIYFPTERVVVSGIEHGPVPTLGIGGASSLWHAWRREGATFGFDNERRFTVWRGTNSLHVETVRTPWIRCIPRNDSLCQVPGGATVIPEHISPTSTDLHNPGIFGILYHHTLVLEYVPDKGVRLGEAYSHRTIPHLWVHDTTYVLVAAGLVLWYAVGAGLSPRHLWRFAPHTSAFFFAFVALWAFVYTVWSTTAATNPRQLARMLRADRAPQWLMSAAVWTTFALVAVTAPSALLVAYANARNRPMRALVSARATLELVMHTALLLTAAHGDIGPHTVFLAFVSTALLLSSRFKDVLLHRAHPTAFLAVLVALYLFVLGGALPLATWALALYTPAFRLMAVAAAILATLCVTVAHEIHWAKRNTLREPDLAEHVAEPPEWA